MEEDKCIDCGDVPCVGGIRAWGMVHRLCAKCVKEAMDPVLMDVFPDIVPYLDSEEGK